LWWIELSDGRESGCGILFDVPLWFMLRGICEAECQLEDAEVGL
jgi:hypothetical protein